MDVDPVVRKRVRVVEDQRHGDEVPVLQAVGRRPHFGRRRGRQRVHQLPQRHGRQQCRCRRALEARRRADSTAVIRAALVDDAPHARVQLDAAPRPSTSRVKLLPHHAGPVPRILELLDQRLDLALAARLNRPNSIDVTAVQSDRPLMRCAAHWALIVWQGMPQTFSV